MTGIVIGTGPALGGGTGSGSAIPVLIPGDKGALRPEGDLTPSNPVELRLYDGRA